MLPSGAAVASIDYLPAFRITECNVFYGGKDAAIGLCVRGFGLCDPKEALARTRRYGAGGNLRTGDVSKAAHT